MGISLRDVSGELDLANESLMEAIESAKSSGVSPKQLAMVLEPAIYASEAATEAAAFGAWAPAAAAASGGGRGALVAHALGGGDGEGLRRRRDGGGLWRDLLPVLARGGGESGGAEAPGAAARRGGHGKCARRRGMVL